MRLTLPARQFFVIAVHPPYTRVTDHDHENGGRMSQGKAHSRGGGEGPSSWGGGRGSMAVEFVILAPIMLLLMLFLVLCGRVIEAHGQVDGAARDAARAASIARTPAEAIANARQAAAGDLNGWCGGSAPAAAVAGFGPGSAHVTATVTCRVDLRFISFGTVTITGSAVAPLDTFVARS